MSTAPQPQTRPVIPDPVDVVEGAKGHRRIPWRWIAAVATGLLAAGTVAIATASPGPGLDPDSQQYLGAAISFARIGAYRVPTSSWTVADTTEPLTHFPPGLPTLLAAPIALGAPPLSAARLVIALAAFATWTGLVLLTTGVASVRTSVLIAVAALFTPAILNVHLSVLSEPVFFAVLVAVLGGLWAGTRSPTLWPALWVGLATAAGGMLRYAGASLVLAAVWWLFVAGPQQMRTRERLARVALAGLPSGVVLAAWLLRSIRLEGVQGVRAFGTYGGLGATGREGLETLVSWAVPLGTGGWRYAIAALLFIGAIMLGRSVWPRFCSTGGFLALLNTVALAYAGFIFASRIVADPNIPFDERILSPLLLLAEIALGLAIAAWWPERSRAARFAVGSVVLLWFAVSAGVSISRIVVAREDGNDFAGSDWRDSPTIAWVRDSAGGAHRTLYTNWPAALYFQAQRASHDVPETLDGLTLHRFRDRLAHTRGAMVGFSVVSPDVAPPDSIAALMGLRLVARFDDGAVWELPGG